MMLLAIDPGVGGTGMAWGPSSQPFPTSVRCLSPKSSLKTWTDRVEDILEQIDQILTTDIPLKDLEAYVEYPVYSSGGRHGVAARRGDLVKLSVITGAIIGKMIVECPVNLPTPNDWKGNLPKDITASRLRQDLIQGKRLDLLATLDTMEDHAWDAVGIWRKFRDE